MTPDPTPSPTPGPWFCESDGIYNATRSYMIVPTGDSDQDRADAAYICALTAQVEKLQRERDEAQRAVKDVHDQLYPVIVERNAEISMLKGAAEAENAKLRDVVVALGKLHKPYTVGVLAWQCVNGDCEHDECPEEDKQVCDECWNLWTQDGRDDECFYDGPVMWPCATAAALDRLGDHQ